MSYLGFFQHYLVILLIPFALIIVGGLFVMADVVLLKRRGDADGVSPFLGSGSRPRPGLRLASVFFFTLASMLAMRDLLSVGKDAPPILFALLIGVSATILSLLILLLGILLSRALGEALHESLPIRAAARLAHWLTIWLDPLAELVWGILSSFLSALHICLLYTSPSPRDGLLSRMPSSA